LIIIILEWSSLSRRSETEFLFLIFNLQIRYDAISFNINNWETLLMSLKIVRYIMNII